MASDLKFWKIETLEIVGYADVLEGTPALPGVLPPVYRLKTDTDVLLLPPFRYTDDSIFGCTILSKNDWEDRVATRRATVLPSPKNARMEGGIPYDLWVDDEGVVHYTPEDDREKRFEEIYAGRMELAEESLRAYRWTQAIDHADIAHAVFPDRLGPLVRRAVADTRLGNDDGELDYTRELAQEMGSLQEFETLLAERLEEFPAALPVRVIARATPRPKLFYKVSPLAFAAHGGGTMIEVATVRPAELYQLERVA